MNVMFAQMSARKGIIFFGEEAIAAIFKEYIHLDQGARPGLPVSYP